MGENSSIEWTTHTFCPWWGCEKVSPGCAHCYADAFAKRLGHGTTRPKLWGPGSERKVASDKGWAEPLRWNRAAEKSGVRARVFCASMADVFEDRPDLVEPRERLWSLIHSTYHLDWLLLTKRPENADRLWRAAWSRFVVGPDARIRSVADPWLPNIWLGTTCEDQARADERIPHLLATPAAVRFLSCEPLLGHVSLDRYVGLREGNRWAECLCDEIDASDRPCLTCDGRRSLGEKSGLHWVIVGSESGPGARPMAIGWAESLREQCSAAGVAYFTKQIATPEGRARGDAKGGDPQWWPGGPSAWPREMPEVRNA